MKITAVFFLLAALTLAAGCSRAPQPGAENTQPRPTTAIDPTTTATISGVVNFEGAPPPRTAIDMTEDPGCALNPKPAFSESILASAGKLENAFVYVKDGLGNYILPSPGAAAVLDQSGCRYVPHVLGVMTGQTLRIKNSDPTSHNIHAASQVNQPFNLGQLPGGAPIDRSFSQPELLVPITCNQHPWMRMYVNVVSNPFFAVSDAKGRFTISGLPPGNYTLEAVHEKLGTQELKITLAPREIKAVSFTFLTPAS